MYEISWGNAPGRSCNDFVEFRFGVLGFFGGEGVLWSFLRFGVLGFIWGRTRAWLSSCTSRRAQVRWVCRPRPACERAALMLRWNRRRPAVWCLRASHASDEWMAFSALLDDTLGRALPQLWCAWGLLEWLRRVCLNLACKYIAIATAM